jgi:hypothetical protein
MGDFVLETIGSRCDAAGIVCCLMLLDIYALLLAI